MDIDQMMELGERLEGKEFTKQQKAKLGSMLESVRANGGKMSDKDKATLTTLMSGQEALSGWLSVLLASNEEWEKMANAIDTADGKAQQMADIKMDTLEGDITTLGSAWEAFQLSLMDGAPAEGMRSFVKGLTDEVILNTEKIFTFH